MKSRTVSTKLFTVSIAACQRTICSVTFSFIAGEYVGVDEGVEFARVDGASPVAMSSVLESCMVVCQESCGLDQDVMLWNCKCAMHIYHPFDFVAQ